MPLRNDKPERLHWTQVISWIAFDDQHAAKDAICGALTHPLSLYDPDKNRTQLTNVDRAIEELFDCVSKNQLRPFWERETKEHLMGYAGHERYAFDACNAHSTKQTLRDIITMGPMTQPPVGKATFDRLYFHSADVFNLWPADASPPGSKTAPESRTEVLNSPKSWKDYEAATAKLNARLKTMGKTVLDEHTRPLAEDITRMMENDENIEDNVIPGFTKMRAHVEKWKAEKKSQK